MALTRVQQDCLERQGACLGCINNVLTPPAACKVKFSNGVAQVLGLQPIKPGATPDFDDDRTYRTCRRCHTDYESKLCPKCWKERACKLCGALFIPGSTVAKFCEACRDHAYDREREVTCQRCGKPFLGRKKAKACMTCRKKLFQNQTMA